MQSFHLGSVIVALVGLSFSVAVRENRLALQIRIGRWEPLYLPSANRAVPIVYNQYDTRTIDFTRSADGHVTGFTISSGRAKRVPFHKLRQSSPRNHGEKKTDS